jgi:hypothetical protein
MNTLVSMKSPGALQESPYIQEPDETSSPVNLFASITPESPHDRTPEERPSNNGILYGLDIVNSTNRPSFSPGHYLAPRQQRDSNMAAYSSDSLSVGDYYCENERELLFSPSTHSGTAPSHVTLTPPISLNAAALCHPQTLSPPLLNGENLSLSSPHSTNDNNNIKSRRNRPPRAPANARFLGTTTTTSSTGKSAVPRAAAPPLPQQPQQPVLHTRSWSHGDSSLMSALTDSSFEQNHHMDHHHFQRPTLWDANIGPNQHFIADNSLNSNRVLYGMDLNIPSSLQQPILDDDEEQRRHSIDREADELVQEIMKKVEARQMQKLDRDNVESNSISDSDSGSDGKPHYERRLTERTCQFEPEAEAHLLKAIERDAANCDMGETLMRNILLFIPESTATNRFERGNVVPLGENERSELDRTNTKRRSELRSAMDEFLSVQEGIAERMKAKNHPVDERKSHAHTPQNIGDQYCTSNTNRLSMALRQGKENQYGSKLKYSEEQVRTPLEKSAKEGNYCAGCVVADIMRLVEYIVSDLDIFIEFLKPRRDAIYQRIKRFLSILAPSILIAAILFCGAGNPPTGTKSNPHDNFNPALPSASWWLVFIGVRHYLLVSLYKCIVCTHYKAPSNY